MSDGSSGGMASKIRKLFKQSHSSAEGSDGGREEEEPTRSARFADMEPTSPSGSGKKKGKKEVRVQEPPSEDGEQQKAKATSAKKSTAEKKGPPPVSRASFCTPS